VTNLYLQGFFESAYAASIIPFASEPTFFAMKAFGGHNMTAAFALAVIGAALGHLFNWWLGKMLRRLPPPGRGMLSEERYARAKAIFHRYGIWLLLFAWAPVCNFLVVAAGFFEVRPRIALPLIIAGLAVHYALALT
jgi:membrane protein YqaA with SNARE-associated domain